MSRYLDIFERICYNTKVYKMKGQMYVEQDITSLNHEIIMKLRECGHFLHYRMGGKAGKIRILIALSEHKELLQRDLQSLLNVQSGSLSEMIIKMETDGFIEKVKSQQDGRNFVLRLTEKGHNLSEDCKRDYEKRINKLMSCFSENQLEELYNMLDEMVVHWRDVGKDWEYSSDRLTK